MSIEGITRYIPDSGFKIVQAKYDHDEIQSSRMAVLNLDLDSQNSLVAQTIDAVSRYQKERRKSHKHFESFVYLREPNGNRYIVAELDANWNDTFDEITLLSLEVIYICETDSEMNQILSEMQSVNPGVIKVGSSSFSEAFAPFREQRDRFRSTSQ